jgi:hypothetical protein
MIPAGPDAPDEGPVRPPPLPPLNCRPAVQARGREAIVAGLAAARVRDRHLSVGPRRVTAGEALQPGHLDVSRN